MKLNIELLQYRVCSNKARFLLYFSTRKSIEFKEDAVILQAFCHCRLQCIINLIDLLWNHILIQPIPLVNQLIPIMHLCTNIAAYIKGPYITGSTAIKRRIKLKPFSRLSWNWTYCSRKMKAILCWHRNCFIYLKVFL